MVMQVVCCSTLGDPVIVDCDLVKLLHWPGSGLVSEGRGVEERTRIFVSLSSDGERNPG